MRSITSGFGLSAREGGGGVYFVPDILFCEERTDPGTDQLDKTVFLSGEEGVRSRGRGGTGNLVLGKLGSADINFFSPIFFFRKDAYGPNR